MLGHVAGQTQVDYHALLNGAVKLAQPFEYCKAYAVMNAKGDVL